MTKTLQDLIDEALFISTEYQARLAELTGDSDWSVDFSAPSFTLKSDPSVSLSPSLLGTESEQRDRGSGPGRNWDISRMRS